MLTEEQIERYSRHIMLKEVGGKGQQRLFDGRVLIIGAGGLGSPIALYLAAAGVGTIGIADADVVDLSNLQRQIAHHTGDIGAPKVQSARDKMVAMNPDVRVATYETWVSAANIADIIREYDFVIDGTDNFAAKFNMKEGEEEQPFIKRFALHALKLQFTGLNGEEISVEAPYPKDFRVLVEALRQNQ